MHKFFSDKKRISLLLFIIILSISLFFRFYKIHDFMIFGMDQENEMLIVKNIASGKHFPLIGLSSSDTGTYRGPLFLYLSVIPYILFHGNPIGGVITASLLGVIVSLLIYKIGTKMFSPAVGLLGALIYSGSFLTAYYDRQFWNPAFIPLLSLVIGFLCFEVVKKKSYFLSIILIILFGISTHAHLTILIFIPLIIWTLWQIRRNLSIKRLLIILLFLSITQLPLVIFDLRHNFLNTRAVVNSFMTPSNTKISSNFPDRRDLFLSTLGKFIWVPPVADFMVESGQCKEYLPLMKNQVSLGISLLIFIFVCLIYWYYRNHSNVNFSKGLYIPVSLTLITLVFISFYNHQIFQYYFSFLFPWLSLLLGWCFIILWRLKWMKYILIPLIILFLFLNMFTLFLSKYSFSYKDKIDALSFASKEVKNVPYSLEALGECPRFGGQRYLSEYIIGTPIHSYMDSYFSWLYPETIKTNPNELIVLLSMIDHQMPTGLIEKWEKIKVQYILNYNILSQARFDKIHVMILSLK